MKRLFRFIVCIYLVIPSACAKGEKISVINYQDLFTGITTPAPDELSMDVLRSYPVFKTIYHDGFDRIDTLPLNSKGEVLAYYVIANDTILSDNAYKQNRAISYREIKSIGNDMHIGVKRNEHGEFVSYNHGGKGIKERIMKVIDTKRCNYGILLKKSSLKKTDAKAAFRIKDIDNFYYVRIYNRQISLTLVEKGKLYVKKRIKCEKEGPCFFLLQDDMLYFYCNWRLIGRCRVEKYADATMCGLYFDGQENSEVDDFVVNYLSHRNESKIDDICESGVFAPCEAFSIGAEKNMITASDKHTNGSKYAIRYELNYHEDWENHKIGYSRRSEIGAKAPYATPLDSWIYSFDIYFPGRHDGNEYYEKDLLEELFWQSHDSNAGWGLSPHVALYLKDDKIRLHTLSRAVLRYDKIDVHSSSYFTKSKGIVAILTDSIDTDSDDLQLRKGEWHRFTLYVKEGYNESHLPRTILYIDNIKVADWFHPNAYNCGQNAEYVQMGIYKWPWATDSLHSDVRRRILYYDNIIYER